MDSTYFTAENFNLISRTYNDISIVAELKNPTTRSLKIKSRALFVLNMEKTHLFLLYKYQTAFIESNIELLEMKKLMPYFEDLDIFYSFGLQNEILFEEEFLDEVTNSILKYNISIERFKHDMIIYTVSDSAISNFILKYENNLDMMNLLFKSMKVLIYHMPKYVSHVLDCEVCSIDNECVDNFTLKNI